MNSKQSYTAQVLVVGAGLAGLCACLELLDRGIQVLLVDGCGPKRMPNTIAAKYTTGSDSTVFVFSLWCSGLNGVIMVMVIRCLATILLGVAAKASSTLYASI